MSDTDNAQLLIDTPQIEKEIPQKKHQTKRKLPFLHLKLQPKENLKNQQNLRRRINKL